MSPLIIEDHPSVVFCHGCDCSCMNCAHTARDLGLCQFSLCHVGQPQQRWEHLKSSTWSLQMPPAIRTRRAITPTAWASGEDSQRVTFYRSSGTAVCLFIAVQGFKDQAPPPPPLTAPDNHHNQVHGDIKAFDDANATPSRKLECLSDSGV